MKCTHLGLVVTVDPIIHCLPPCMIIYSHVRRYIILPWYKVISSLICLGDKDYKNYEAMEFVILYLNNCDTLMCRRKLKIKIWWISNISCFILILKACRGKEQKTLIQSWIKSPIYKIILTHEGVGMLPSVRITPRNKFLHHCNIRSKTPLRHPRYM